MNIKDGWVVLIAVGCALAGLLFGFGLCHDSVLNDCKNIGKFELGDRVWICTEDHK